MCWTSKFSPHKQTARENVPIFKIGRFYGIVVKSYFQHFSYELNHKYIMETKLELKVRVITRKSTKIVNGLIAFVDTGEVIGTEISIDKGFHSYSIDCAYKKWYDSIIVSLISGHEANYSEQASIIEGYIPEGAHYYENEKGEIVSDQIVLTNYRNI